MAKTLANCTIWLDDVNIASQVNQVTIQQSAKEIDATTFANAGMARLGGLEDAVISCAGLWESLPDPDFSIFGDVGLNVPITVALAQNAAAGAPAYLMGAELAQYGGIGGKVGNAMAFSLRAAQNLSLASGKLAQGILAENRTGISATGNGSIYGPLAVPANSIQTMVAALHCTAASGTTPSMTIALQSATTGGFGSPTTRATFNALTGVGSQIISIQGPITDAYWRFIWTISGTGPSFSFAASLGLAT